MSEIPWNDADAAALEARVTQLEAQVRELIEKAKQQSREHFDVIALRLVYTAAKIPMPPNATRLASLIIFKGTKVVSGFSYLPSRHDGSHSRLVDLLMSDAAHEPRLYFGDFNAFFDAVKAGQSMRDLTLPVPGFEHKEL